MSELDGGLGALDAELADLEVTIGDTRAMSRAFSAELQRMQGDLGQASRQVDGFARSIGWGLRRAFDGLVFDGMRLSDALKLLGRTMVDSVLTQALKPVQNALGAAIATGIEGLVGGVVGAALPFRDGAPFSQGRVMPFARGGIVSRATAFPMRGGIGLMGEAGPEAIMPLSRGADGRLGVRVEGRPARPVTVVMNIATPDVAGFASSRTQIAARLRRALEQGARNA